ncbi:hypothetical protein [Streptomyces sp. A30]|uniref:hypothetical protein n=1 Tax=Streptomyces sp. A30 TaxID=2789273 RepID=UPI00397E96B6
MSTFAPISPASPLQRQQGDGTVSLTRGEIIDYESNPKSNSTPNRPRRHSWIYIVALTCRRVTD